MKVGPLVIGIITVAAAVLVVGGVVAVRDPGGRALAPGTPPLATASPADPKAAPPPPGYTSPTAGPRYLVTGAQDLITSLKTDSFAQSALNDLTSPGSPFFDSSVKTPPAFGLPVFVQAYSVGKQNEWLVPVIAEGKTIGVIAVSIDASNRGAAGAFSRWAGAFPHPLSLAEATTTAGTPTDPVQSIGLAWAVISPLEGGPTTELSPFYRAVRLSGTQVLILQNGSLLPASQVHPLG